MNITHGIKDLIEQEQRSMAPTLVSVYQSVNQSISKSVNQMRHPNWVTQSWSPQVGPGVDNLELLFETQGAKVSSFRKIQVDLAKI